MSGLHYQQGQTTAVRTPSNLVTFISVYTQFIFRRKFYAELRMVRNLTWLKYEDTVTCVKTLSQSDSPLDSQRLCIMWLHAISI